MSPKELKKLAEVCRKAGILHYKCAEFEFTLSAEPPPKVVNRASKQTIVGTDTGTAFESDTLTEQQLLMWSVGDIPGNEA